MPLMHNRKYFLVLDRSRVSAHFCVAQKRAKNIIDAPFFFSTLSFLTLNLETFESKARIGRNRCQKRPAPEGSVK